MRGVFSSTPRENHLTQAQFAQIHQGLERQMHTLTVALDEALARISALEGAHAQTDDYLEALNQRDHRIHARLTRIEAASEEDVQRIKRLETRAQGLSTSY